MIRLTSWIYRYPSIPNLMSMSPTYRLLLDQKLYWTEKEDGENIAVWMRDGNIQISSRNQIDAHKDIVSKVKKAEDDYDKIVELLQDNPQYVVYVEECMKGNSVTKVKKYDRPTLFLFDILDRDKDKFLHYVVTHQTGYHYDIPVVNEYAETIFQTQDEILDFKDKVLDYCKKSNLEGMVVKGYSIPDRYSNWRQYGRGLIQAKVKIDTPKPKVRFKSDKKEPEYPPLPDSEVWNTIDKVWQELGTKDFKSVEIAMPLFAKKISEEYKKGLYSKPKRSLYYYYKDYLRRVLRDD